MPLGAVRFPRGEQRTARDKGAWKVFGGRYADVYLALLKERCVRDGFGTDADTLSQQLRLHMHRGISYLAANKSLKKIDDLISLAVS